MGKECSGYRTQLTWGVGVASRGKLRGLSLPVLNTDSKPYVSAAQKARTASAGAAGTGAPTKRQRSTSLKTEPVERTFVLKTEPMAAEHCFATAPLHISTTTQSPTQYSPSHTSLDKSWQMPAPPPPLQPRHSYTLSPLGTKAPAFPGSGQFQSAGQFHQNPPLSRTASFDAAPLSSSTGSSRSTTSLGNFFDASYSQQQIQFSPTPIDESPFLGPFFSQYGPASSYDASPTLLNPFQQFYAGGASPCLSMYDVGHQIMSPHLPESNGTLNAAPPQSVFENRAELSPHHEEAPAHLPFEDIRKYGDMDMDEVEGITPNSTLVSLSIPRSFTDMELYGLSPRMQYLMDYYDKLICPVLVILDGPTNPYRKHVFPLAIQNIGLQNAIAALVTNNMRMRSLKEVKALTDGSARKRRDSGDSLPISIRQPTSEETHYKAQSIELLNAQLADRSKARDDSILATLLILCLFHVCDSGFSKFQTQLAGVQKLLKMRGATSSEFVGWVHMFFAWFDVMTSSVNDRETQISTDSFEHMQRAPNSSAAEQFSGCDGRLFKLIARLSRLNLLSQSRPVRDMTNVEPLPEPPRKFDAYADPALFQFDLLDGNGWARPVIPDDPSAPDTRTTFWKEWREIREQLEAVQFQDLYSSNSTTPASSSLSIPEQDLVHISESFRYAALLYTERLAYPFLPSSSSNFADLVSRAVHHIAQIGVNSCVTKFLLWPVFIIGSECVLEADQDLIRSKCVEIQRESGFYNNLSGLEVLEKVWREGEVEWYFGNNNGGCVGQALKWRKAMNRIDGEYIIV